MRKHKIQIVIILVLLIIVCILAGIFLFQEKEQSPEQPEPTTEVEQTPEVDDNEIVLIAENENGEISAIRGNGEEVVLMDPSRYDGFAYTYYQERLYLYLGPDHSNEASSGNTLGYIDLTQDDYPFTILGEVVGENAPESIAVAGNTIYYTTSTGNIYLYNMESGNNVETHTLDIGANASLYTVSDEVMGYSSPGMESLSGSSDPSIGIVNVQTGEKQVIDDNAIVQFLYQGNLVYLKYVATDHSTWEYYEYRISDGTITKISNETSAAVTSLDDTNIVPVEGGYIYVNQNTLYQFKNNEIQKLYEFDGPIYFMNLVSRNELNLMYQAQVNPEQNTSVSYYQKLNLDTLELEEAENKQYSKMLYIR